jgi:Flp pilus assembly protein TadG
MRLHLQPALLGHRRRRRGAATVEMAVVAPLLILLVLGIIEFGRGMMVQQILTNGARHGARQAALAGATTTKVKAAIQDYLEACGIQPNRATITMTGVTGQMGDAVTVRIRVAYKDFSWLGVDQIQFLRNTALEGAVVMRKEGR